MRKTILYIFFLSQILLVPVNSLMAQSRIEDGQLLVALKAGTTPLDFAPQEGSGLWRVKGQVAAYIANIWLLELVPGSVAPHITLEWLRKQPTVIQAQWNHQVAERDAPVKNPAAPDASELSANIPNDPDFLQQWHWNNTGQSGGTPGVDLGMPAAWDITTGGVGPLGDSVVVAVIDGGICPFCDDWGDNLWQNHHEIPNDGLDNDQNGFIDDFSGWNVNALNDNIIGTNTSHGTSVAGIIAAKGNDGIGITGMMWDTKLMMVAALNSGGTTEAQVFAAYDYIFKQRKDYNDTHGAQGAFVVAINCSFGINFGSPAQSPIWCNILDQLGEAGLLTVCAVANGDWNVEEVGDIPTTCPSDYLISVTSVDHHDQKSNSAGWGNVSVDLGAFGKEVYTLSTSPPWYAYRSGTSFSAPQVTGAVGLLYTAPCNNISALAKQTPEMAALFAKNQILGSVQPNSSLSDITLTGGRLQVAQLLTQYESACQDCMTPFWPSVSQITTTQANLQWQQAPAVEAVRVRWSIAGDSLWTMVEDIQSPYTLSGLSPCTTYHIELSAQCDSVSWSTWTALLLFTTDGCCVPPSISALVPVSESELQCIWTPGYGRKCL